MARSYLLQEDGACRIILEDGSGFLLLEISAVDYGSPHIIAPTGTSNSGVYDMRWIGSFSVLGDLTEIVMWGDTTARVKVVTADFLPLWATSRASNPQLPWGRPLLAGDATLTVGASTYNLLHVDNWYEVGDGTDEVAVRFYGSPTMWDMHSADGMEPAIRFDKTTFENAMNAFTLG